MLNRLQLFRNVGQFDSVSAGAAIALLRLVLESLFFLFIERTPAPTLDLRYDPAVHDLKRPCLSKREAEKRNEERRRAKLVVLGSSSL